MPGRVRENPGVRPATYQPTQDYQELPGGKAPVFLFHEGFSINDHGHLISSVYVDLRDSADRTPITTLVKAGEKRFAIDFCRRMRISRRSRFREYGENLIRDEWEGYSSHTISYTERTDDPEDLARARLRDDELNRASQLVGLRATTTTESVTSWERSYRSLTFGGEAWVFCASIQPVTAEEKEQWWKTMPAQYDHLVHIRRPREFARSLCSMVAEQLGPQCKEQEMKHTFDGEFRLRTGHKGQVLLHGPVIYVDDPYATISSAPEGWGFLAMSSLVKHVKYRDQREYRFVVLSQDEPATETEDLVVSQAMLGAMGGPTVRSCIAINWEKDSSSPSKKSTGVGPDAAHLESDDQSGPPLLQTSGAPPRLPDPKQGSVSITPNTPGATDLPEDFEEVATTYAAVKALRKLVGGPFGRQHPEAASSAWYIEPCIRRLCATFEDPIGDLRVTEDNFVVVTLKFPRESKSEGKIAVGPLGTGNCRIKTERGETPSLDHEAWRLAMDIEDILEEAGLPARRNAPDELHEASFEDG